MKFRSEYERKKWAALQSSSDASLKSIISGKGTAADTAKVSNAMGQMSRLAQEVFDEGVTAAEQSAKAAVKALNERRVSKGKAPLTAEAFSALFEAAFARQMAKEVPALVQDIHDTILIELYEQDDRFKSELSSQFDRFREHIDGNDAPSVDDMISLFDLNREVTAKADDKVWKEREEGLLEKIADTFRHTLKEVAASVQAARERSAGPGGSPFGHRSSRLAIEGPKGDWEVVDVDPGTHEAVKDLKALNDMSSGGPPPAAEQSGLMSVVAKYATPLLPGPEGATAHGETSTSPVVSLSHKADAAIITAAEQQTGFHERITEALQDIERDAADAKEDEDEEQTGFFRKMRSFMGDKKKDKDEDSGGDWWEAAALALLAAMTDPGLFEAISKKVKEVLTWEHIKDVLGSTLDWLWRKAGDMVDWVLDKIGLGKPKVTDNVDDLKDQGGAVIPASQASKLEAAKALPDPFHSGGTADPSKVQAQGDTGHASWQSTVNNFLGKHFGFRMDGGADSSGGTASSAPISVGGADGSIAHYGPDGQPIGTATSVPGNSSTTNVGGNTTNVGGKTVSVQNGSPVSYKTVPATAPAAPAGGGAATANGARPTAPTKSGSIGLGSIPTLSGISDSLAITNLGMLM